MLVMATAKPRDQGAAASTSDLAALLPGGNRIEDVLVWIREDMNGLTWLIGGDDGQVRGMMKWLSNAERNGDLSQLRSMKIKRPSPE